MIAIVLKARVAAHSVPRCHAISLVTVERAAIRTVMARILALIEKSVRHCVIHYATLMMTMSSDEGAPLRNQLPIILLVLI